MVRMKIVTKSVLKTRITNALDGNDDMRVGDQNVDSE